MKNNRNGNMPASPVKGCDGRFIDCTDDNIQWLKQCAPSVGLSKREAFAKDLPHIEVDFGDLDVMCKFIGVKEVPESIDEILAVTFAAEAKIRVMRADAHLAELEK